MKYLHQAAVLAAVTLAAEILKSIIPLPVPASIYGLVLLFLLLKTGAVKLHQVEDVGELLLELMPLLLVPASVNVVSTMDVLGGMLVPVLISGFVGTLLVMLVTGRTAQAVLSSARKKEDAAHE